MHIEYHKPTARDKRRRAGFWIAAGQFLSSTAVGYLVMVIAIILVWIIVIAKAFKEIL